MNDNGEVFLRLFKHMANIESLTVDPSIEAFLWEQHDQGKLAAILPRLAHVNGFSVLLGCPEAKDVSIRYVMDNLWKLAGCMRLGPETYWYIMDELGGALGHSDLPNMVIFPLLYSRTNSFANEATTISVIPPFALIQTRSCGRSSPSRWDRSCTETFSTR